MKVKVILKENIKGVGKKDDIIEVKDGYANNFLFAQNKAVPATPENINKLKNQKDKINKNIEKEINKANELKKIIEEGTVTLKIKMGKDGKVFGSIGAKEIEEAVKKQLNIEVDKRKMGNDAKIKSLGMHKVEVKLYVDIKASINVNVIGE